MVQRTLLWNIRECYCRLRRIQKNERILSGEGLTPFPCNLNFHNHYQEVVPGVIEEVSAYDTLGNKIATWTAYKSTAAKDNKNITNCRNCGALVKSYIC